MKQPTDGGDAAARPTPARAGSRRAGGLLCLVMMLGAVRAAHAAPVAGQSTKRLDFGNQLIGQRSPAQYVRITNNGTSPLTISSIRLADATGSSVPLGGYGPADYVLNPGAGPTTLGPGASLTVGIQFRPNPPLVGECDAYLWIFDNDTVGHQVVILTGTAVTTYLHRDPDRMDFGATLVGSDNQKVLFIGNDSHTTMHFGGGGAPLAWIGGPNAGDFYWRWLGVLPPLLPGQGTSIMVGFRPGRNSIGQRTATLAIFDDAPFSPHLVPLTGSGFVAVPPSAPSLSLHVLSPTTLDIICRDDAIGVTGMEIWRQAGAGNFSRVDVGSPPFLELADHSVTSGVTYTYRARVADGVGLSPWSNTVSATPYNPPNPPFNLHVKALSSSALQLTWTSPATNMGTGYEIWRAGPGTGFTFRDVAPGAATQYIDRGLPPHTGYIYRVRATGNGGPSGWSNTDGNITLSGP